MEVQDLPSDLLDFLSSDKTTDTTKTEEGEKSFIRRSVIQRNCNVSGLSAQPKPPCEGYHCLTKPWLEPTCDNVKVFLLTRERSVRVRDRRRKCWSVCYPVITAVWSSPLARRGRATPDRGRTTKRPSPANCRDQTE